MTLERTDRTDRTDGPRTGRRPQQAPGTASTRRRVAGERARARQTRPEPGSATGPSSTTAGSTTPTDTRRTPVGVPAAPSAPASSGAGGRERAPARRHLLSPAGGAAAAPTDAGSLVEPASGRPPAGVRRVFVPVRWSALVGSLASPLTAVLAALALVAAGGAGYLWTQVRADRGADAARSAALSAAVSAAPVVLSYDSAHLDQDFAAAEQHLTGSFEAQYAKTTATVVKPTATQVKAKVAADVVAASVVSARPDRVVVLLFVDQTTTSTKVQGPRRDLNRVRMTLVPVQGEWKVSGIDAL